jgi:hypothetical protein
MDQYTFEEGCGASLIKNPNEVGSGGKLEGLTTGSVADVFLAH